MTRPTSLQSNFVCFGELFNSSTKARSINSCTWQLVPKDQTGGWQRKQWRRSLISPQVVTKCSLHQLNAYVTRTLLGQGLLQTAQMTSRLKLPVCSEGPAYHPMSSLVMGLSPPHSVINVGDDKHEWLTLLHLIATYRPAHLLHEYTMILTDRGCHTS